MAKLVLNLAEGDTISFQRQGEFLAVAHIKDNKEMLLGLLGRADLGHLHSFLNNEIFNQVQATVSSVPQSIPGLTIPDNPRDFIRMMVKEVKKEMNKDEDEEV